MNRLIEPDAVYDGWVDGFTTNRYNTQILLENGAVLPCVADRDKAHEDPKFGPEHHRSDPIRIGHVVFEVDAGGVAVLHGDFVAAMPKRFTAA